MKEKFIIFIIFIASFSCLSNTKENVTDPTVTYVVEQDNLDSVSINQVKINNVLLERKESFYEQSEN